MAKQLEEFPEGLKAGRSSRYPWDGPDGWFNGKVWEVSAGEDFTTTVESFRTTVKSAARTRGGIVKAAKADDKTLIFQFVKT